MNALIRTFAVTIVLCGAILLGYWQLTLDQQAQTIRELQALQAEMEQTLAARQAMIDRLSRSRRIAHVEVLGQTADDAGGVRDTTVQFIELDDEGGELARQSFTVPGGVLFIDAWAVKFDPERVAQGDPLRGRTLILLRRIYSDRLAPRDGFAIDTPGAIPPGYAASDVSRFEKRVWENFWNLARDAAQARDFGVRVAQGEAVYKPVHAGERYELLVDAAGGMSFTPLEAETPEALSWAEEHRDER